MQINNQKLKKRGVFCACGIFVNFVLESIFIVTIFIKFSQNHLKIFDLNHSQTSNSANNFDEFLIALKTAKKKL